MAPIPHCRAGKVWLVCRQVGVLPQHVSGEPEHSPPPAPERLYLQMHARVHDQIEDLAEERADGTHTKHHGEFFRPAAERLRPGQPPGSQLRLADCDDYSVWSFHPV